MALANPRKLVVQGKMYHWKVSHRNFHVVVLEPGTRRKLVVFYAEKQTVTPAIVRGLIGEAEEQGWTGNLQWNR